MTILLERAGAQRGLLLRVSDNLIPEIEASAWTGTGGVLEPEHGVMTIGSGGNYVRPAVGG